MKYSEAKKYRYACLCKCGARMEINLNRKLDFPVMCILTECDLQMSTFLEDWRE